MQGKRDFVNIQTYRPLRHSSISDPFPSPQNLIQIFTMQPVLYLRDIPIWQSMGTSKTSKNKPKLLLHKIPPISKCS